MSCEEALKVLQQLAAGYRGTLQEHQVIQEALSVVDKALKKEEI